MKSTYIFGFILLGVVLCLQSVFSMRYSADEKSYLDSPYTARDLASWLMEMAQRNDHSHKRNSEIINSLLGVPKLMNDAGRK